MCVVQVRVAPGVGFLAWNYFICAAQDHVSPGPVLFGTKCSICAVWDRMAPGADCFLLHIIFVHVVQDLRSSAWPAGSVYVCNML
jgi:hypothetical protein